MLGLVYDSMRKMTSPPVRRWIKSQSWFTPLARAIFGNDVYSTSYYRQIEKYEAESVHHISTWIVEHLSPRKVIDVGSGPGHFMKALADKNIDVMGIDISNAAEQFAAAKGLKFHRYDLTKSGRPPGGPWDLVICCEVAEHLDEK